MILTDAPGWKQPEPPLLPLAHAHRPGSETATSIAHLGRELETSDDNGHPTQGASVPLVRTGSQGHKKEEHLGTPRHPAPPDRITREDRPASHRPHQIAVAHDGRDEHQGGQSAPANGGHRQGQGQQRIGLDIHDRAEPGRTAPPGQRAIEPVRDGRGEQGQENEATRLLRGELGRANRCRGEDRGGAGRTTAC